MNYLQMAKKKVTILTLSFHCILDGTPSQTHTLVISLDMTKSKCNCSDLKALTLVETNKQTKKPLMLHQSKVLSSIK